MRIARACVPGLVHHIIGRFTDRRFLVGDDDERAAYLALFAKAMSTSDWRCFAYAIMSSHFHLAMLAGETPPERWMRRVHPSFAMWMNQRHNGLGGVIANRCSIWLVRPELEVDTIAYIHNNPVTAGVVRTAAESSWTSHRAYAGMVETPPWLHVDLALQRNNIDRAEFIAKVDGMDLTDLEAVRHIHKAARKRGLIEVGTPIAGDPVEVPLLVRRSTLVRPTVETLLATVDGIVGVELATRMKRTAIGTHARMVAVHLARVLGMPLVSIAAATGISPQMCSRLAIRELTELQRAQVKACLAKL